MRRSSTTRLEQVLCSESRAHGAGELRDFRKMTSAHLKHRPMDQAAEWVPKRTDAPFQESSSA